MDKSHPLYVVLLWHMHQPYYRNRLNGACPLPWVRLHGLKNYYDIPAIGAEFPEIRQTFNLVPSLLTQLEDYILSDGSDAFLDITKKSVDDLTTEERLFLLRNFFLANTDTMVNPYPRYRQLLEKRGLYGTLDDVTRTKEWFTPQDFLDLQVWFHLTWSGYTLLDMPEVRALFDKGSHFTEDDKHRLLDIQQNFLADIIPQYRRLQESGQIEVSISPFYHPILPLLCDTNEARVAMPDVPLPSRPFTCPDDANVQIQRSVAFYSERFGRPPRGMWPSEGSVSESIIPLVANAGIQWMASDDEVLAHSLRGTRASYEQVPALTPEQRYRPYRVGDQAHGVNILFRDHLLSDRFGFVYSRWKAEDAARDLVSRLLDIRRQLPSREPAVVPIILDGENAWEYYTNHGRDFFRKLYGLLSDTPEIRTVTVSEALEHVEALPLGRLFSGSWIGHNFSTWIGHPEKNAGWECLEDARRRLVEYEQQTESETDGRLQDAWESLYAAEGSDWFWWYGDDHSSLNDEEFDLLFRMHVGNVYRALDLPVPDRLLRPIRQPRVIQPSRQPMGSIKPHLDGRATSYYEWLSAGYYDVHGGRGSMHQAETFLKRMYYGFDDIHLYLRIDTATPLTEEICRDFRLSIQFRLPEPCHFMITCAENASFTLLVDGKESAGTGAHVSVDRLIEFAVPLEHLHAKPHDMVEFELTLYQDGMEVEHWPQSGVIRLTVPDNIEDSDWFV